MVRLPLEPLPDRLSQRGLPSAHARLALDAPDSRLARALARPPDRGTAPNRPQRLAGALDRTGVEAPHGQRPGAARRAPPR